MVRATLLGYDTYLAQTEACGHATSVPRKWSQAVANELLGMQMAQWLLLCSEPRRSGNGAGSAFELAAVEPSDEGCWSGTAL